jgi:hypothetical protein
LDTSSVMFGFPDPPASIRENPVNLDSGNPAEVPKIPRNNLQAVKDRRRGDLHIRVG